MQTEKISLENKNRLSSRHVLLVGAAIAAGFAVKKIKRAKAAKLEIKSFIDEAIAKGFAEIQNARTLIEQSNSIDIKIYAQRVLDDYVNFNQRLIDIARAKKLPIPTIESYQEAAKPFLLTVNDNSQLDQAYITHRLNFHTSMSKLFRAAGNSKDPLINELLSLSLEQLNRHFRAATELMATCHSNEIRTCSPKPIEAHPLNERQTGEKF